LMTLKRSCSILFTLIGWLQLIILDWYFLSSCLILTLQLQFF